jgi:peptidoglycan biosynthesis protein MviN/MurJ (putative lipid II flippase)
MLAQPGRSGMVMTLLITKLIIGITAGYLIDFFMRRRKPVDAALVGLIPNCAASVAIATLFLKGGISFGSAVAGLCCSGGLGLLVLVRENRDVKDTLRIVALLFFISAAAGLAIQFLFP